MRDRMTRHTRVVAAITLFLVACGSRVAPLSTGLQGGQPGTNPTAVTSTGPLPSTGPSTGPTGSGGGGGNLQIPGAANCKSGGATDVGVTATSVKLGAVISITGPLPGQFDSARDAVASYIASVNEQGGICGRRLNWT